MTKPKDFLFTVDSTVQGIPCKLGVTSVGYYEAAYTYGHPDNWEPPEYESHDYTILDRKGYRADWLMKKSDQKDFDRHQKDIDNYLSEVANDY